jgi:outer membrane immunogenic protein
VSSRQTHAGWTIGGGIEAMFGGNWSGKLEYLYMDLGSFDNTVALAAPPIGAAISSRLTDNIFRAGINYHFSAGPGGRALLIVLPANKASGTFSVPLASAPSWSGRPRSSS